MTDEGAGLCFAFGEDSAALGRRVSFCAIRKKPKNRRGPAQLGRLASKFALPPDPVYGGRPLLALWSRPAGGLLTAAAPYSLPLSSISGAGGSIGLQRAWMLQYTPFLWGVTTRRAV